MYKFISLFTICLSFVFIIDNFSEYKKINKKLKNPLIPTSSEVNEIYSQKFIENDLNEIYPTKSFSKYKFKDYGDNNKDNRIALDKNNFDISIDLTNLDWKKKFSEKKISFIETLLPLITYENLNINLERKKLFDIKNFLEFNKTLSDENIKYLTKTSNKYNVYMKNKHKIDIINELLTRVDGIPNSIVLAQAVNESGWGTSRFAREYNALFGQYTYDENNGIVPNQREEGKKHLIKNFTSINKSIESYFKNINTHRAYSDFRQTRNKIRNQDIQYNITILVDTLAPYAEDKSYVDTINSIINSNNFEQFDFKKLNFIDS